MVGQEAIKAASETVKGGGVGAGAGAGVPLRSLIALEKGTVAAAQKAFENMQRGTEVEENDLLEVAKESLELQEENNRILEHLALFSV